MIDWQSLTGGLLIGLACSAYLILDGRIAGISGIVGRTLGGKNIWPGAALLLGLAVGPVLWRLASGAWPDMTVSAPWPLLLLSGFLVGFGTRLGSGCTSGHGVLGLARLSRRSLVAVTCFLGTGIITATLLPFLIGR